MPAASGRPIRTVLALTVTAASLTSVSLPAHAWDGGAFVAGLIGGTAAGALAGAAIASAPPPPPVYYAPAYVPPPPPHCWWEPRQVWTGYAWVIQQVRVCN
jgi:hypothetical protein